METKLQGDLVEGDYGLRVVAVNEEDEIVDEVYVSEAGSITEAKKWLRERLGIKRFHSTTYAYHVGKI